MNFKMKRRHAFEFTDQRWLPERFRGYLTDLLQYHLDEDKTYDVVIPILSSVLARSHDAQLVDVCSGSSGPWKRWLAEKKIKAGPVTLTDKFPGRALVKAERLPDGLTLHPHAVDALKIPPSIEGDLTFFTCFHHFKPDDAVTILKNAVTQGRSICLFEFTERKLSTLFGMLFSPLVVLVLTCQLRPISFSRIFWTCIVPVVPMLYFWDGSVSHLRTYSLRELTNMHNAFENDYRWELGALPVPDSNQKVSYLVGYPRDRVLIADAVVVGNSIFPDK